MQSVFRDSALTACAIYDCAFLPMELWHGHTAVVDPALLPRDYSRTIAGFFPHGGLPQLKPAIKRRNQPVDGGANLALAAAMWVCLTIAGVLASFGGQDPALAAFDDAIARYLSLRQEIAREVPGPRLSTAPDEIVSATFALADAIKSHRPSATAGDLLTLEVGILMRARIERALKMEGLRASDLLADYGDDVPATGAVQVYDEFPWEVALGMPAALIEVLPDTPESLEFRLVGTSLVLVDVDACLVLDVLPDALPLENHRLIVEIEHDGNGSMPRVSQ